MSKLTFEVVKTLVEQQLSQITDVIVRDALSALLIPPSCHYRDWFYGGESTLTYPCWSVALHQSSDILYVYCEEGFGPLCPWGIVFQSGNSMGVDSSWFTSLERAFYDSFATTPLLIWRVVKRGTSEEQREIASNLTHDDAIKLIKQLNEQAGLPVDDNGGWSEKIYAIEPRTQRWD